MNPSLTANCICALLAAASLQARAQTAMPKTREQVRQELVQALRDGSMISAGDTGLAMRDVYPGRYPQASSAAPRARRDVLAELEAAQRSGDLLTDGDSGLKLNQLYPMRYSQPTVLAGKTRAQVKAELAEAQRTGDMLASGESGLKLNELHPGTYPRASAPLHANAQAGATTKSTNDSRGRPSVEVLVSLPSGQ